jgi:hypothetical protein
MHRTQAPRHKAGILQLTDPEGEIDPLFYDVHVPVREIACDFDLGPGLQECRGGVADETLAEGLGCGDAQRA